MTFEPIAAFSRVRLSDVVADQLKTMICDGRLLPGARLPAERELAAQLQVSRPSLREALIRLQADGYVASTGRGGLRVADVTASLVSSPLAELIATQPRASADILELRHGLETTVTGYAAARADAGDLARIDTAFATLQDCFERRDKVQLAAADAAFHLTIADATHNVALIHVMHGLHGLIRETTLNSHRMVGYDDGIETALFTQHGEIHAAILSRNVDRARSASEAHLDYVRELHRQRGALTRN
ncbi:FadR/GntR family transcriptional regulator [Chitinasiproducens palmae]|uniref:Pyruvate dehydrogenase complex repressor n=1 Tax=Chitinasiproducens palmae TaxID=1770053 RepID=A0A1H2PU79_9BURK|nr:FadR/GntR family transcriptional regulator [Chitinasiproducens palmae]SDV50346.1 transcriptional regulator, GntR family [Chitinasiproducens palmae]